MAYLRGVSPALKSPFLSSNVQRLRALGSRHARCGAHRTQALRLMTYVHGLPDERCSGMSRVGV
eukprot:scaffold264904_cov18-Tisochrysis_lutea.AAC.1